MTGHNWWDLKGYFGSHPKKFKKEAREQIENSTLQYLQKYGKKDWVSTEEIFENIIEPTDLFNSNKGKIWFAQNGVKAKVNSATNKWRRKGYPIISGKGHKGYRYADETCDDVADVWTEKFTGWQKRINKLNKERQIDLELLLRVIKKLREKGKGKEARELEELYQEYTRKRNL